MNPIFIFGCGVLGLILGSFVNAAVYRLRYRKPGLFFGRSKCIRCGHTLHARDLIPLLSYLLLHGRCRYCDKGIGSHYAWTELLFALTFIVVALFTPFGEIGLLTWNLLFAGILLFLASYDMQFGEIPDEISLPAAALALIGIALPFTLSLGTGLIGLFVGGGFFAGLVLISNGKWMGGGDIRMGLLLGALVGWKGFLIALFFASVVGSVVGLTQVIRKKRKLRSPLPFGPFLALGGIIAILFTNQVWEWYVGSFL
ncbi:MAG: A24 family peptidase [Patescibacteria group bacterium]